MKKRQPTLEEFLDKLPPQQQHIALVLHDWICNNTNCKTTMRFKIPFYDANKWVAYLNPVKNNGIELNFLQARHFVPLPEELDFRGRKMVAGAIFYAVSDIHPEILRNLFNIALATDAHLPRK